MRLGVLTFYFKTPNCVGSKQDRQGKGLRLLQQSLLFSAEKYQQAREAPTALTLFPMHFPQFPLSKLYF